MANDVTLENPLAKLREPFPINQISKLPKPTKAQTDAVKANFKTGIRCKVCNSWHHPDVTHLDYVGHAALTDRLLDTDPEWSWEPVAFNQSGLPALDQNGGLWIRLTVCGVSRLGYGDADGKSGGNAIKEAIGDALRNAAMRFGAALDLWHKGDLHLDDDTERVPDMVIDHSQEIAASQAEEWVREQIVKFNAYTKDDGDAVTTHVGTASYVKGKAKLATASPKLAQQLNTAESAAMARADDVPY